MRPLGQAIASTGWSAGRVGCFGSLFVASSMHCCSRISAVSSDAHLIGFVSLVIVSIC